MNRDSEKEKWKPKCDWVSSQGLPLLCALYFSEFNLPQQENILKAKKEPTERLQPPNQTVSDKNEIIFACLKFFLSILPLMFPCERSVPTVKENIHEHTGLGDKEPRFLLPQPNCALLLSTFAVSFHTTRVNKSFWTAASFGQLLKKLCKFSLPLSARQTRARMI